GQHALAPLPHVRGEDAGPPSSDVVGRLPRAQDRLVLSFVRVRRVIQVTAVPQTELAEAPAATDHAARDAAVHHAVRRRPGYSEERLLCPIVVQPFAGFDRTLPASSQYLQEGRAE